MAQFIVSYGTSAISRKRYRVHAESGIGSAHVAQRTQCQPLEQQGQFQVKLNSMEFSRRQEIEGFVAFIAWL